MVQKQEKSRLADLLVEMRLVDEDSMSSALQEHRASGRRLQKVLADRRLVDEERLAKSVAAKLGLEAISLAGMKIHERVVALLPTAVASKYGVIPIAIKRTNTTEMLYLVMCDPLDTEAIGEVQRITGRQVRVLLATASDVEAAIEEHYKSRPPAVTSAPPPPKPMAARPGGLPAASKPTTPPQFSPPIQPAKPALPTAPPPRRADSGLGLPPPQRATPSPRRSASQVGLPSAAPISLQANKGSRAAPSPLAPTPLSTLVPPEPPPAVVRGSPFSSGSVAEQDPLPSFASPSAPATLEAPRAPIGLGWARDLPVPPAQDAFRPTLIDSPRPAELQQLFVTELQREGPLGRMPKAKPRTSAELVFPSELDPPDAVSTGVDMIPDDEATAQPGVNQPHIEAEWDRAVKDWDSHDARESEAFARDGVVVVGDALGSPSGSADAPPRRDSDPVTTEAALADIIMVEPIEATPSVMSDPRPRINEGSGVGPRMSALSHTPSSLRNAPARPSPQLDPPRRGANEAKVASFAALLAESRAQVELEEGEDIKTSQLELSEISAAELRREAQRPPEPIKPSRRPIKAAQIMELPLEMEESAHPFDGPKQTDVPIGLERTGIIPALDWENGEFRPPPLPVAKAVETVRPLAGSGDIPSTPEVVRLRAVSTVHGDAAEDDIQDIEEVSLDPIPTSDLELIEPEPVAPVEAKKRRSDPPAPVDIEPTESLDMPPPDSDTTGMPVIEPSSLASLIDDAPRAANTNSERAPVLTVPETRLFDESNRPPAARSFARAEEEPTNPRIETLALLATLDANGEEKRPTRPEPVVAPPPARPIARTKPTTIEAPTEEPTPAQDAVDRGSVLSALQQAFVETGKQEAAPLSRSAAQESARSEARALIAALTQGESLSSAERVQLVLAIARLLLKKGLISADELMDEL